MVYLRQPMEQLKTLLLPQMGQRRDHASRVGGGDKGGQIRDSKGIP